MSIDCGQRIGAHAGMGRSNRELRLGNLWRLLHGGIGRRDALLFDDGASIIISGWLNRGGIPLGNSLPPALNCVFDSIGERATPLSTSQELIARKPRTRDDSRNGVFLRQPIQCCVCDGPRKIKRVVFVRGKHPFDPKMHQQMTRAEMTVCFVVTNLGREMIDGMGYRTS